MHPILVVFVKEFTENLRERRTLFTALVLGPVLLPLMFAGGLALTLEHSSAAVDKPVTIAVTHSERAPKLVAYLRMYGLTITPLDLDVAGTREAVRTRRFHQILDVSADFGSHLAGGTPAPVELYTDASDINAAGEVQRVRGILQRYNDTVARRRITARGIDPLILTPLAVQDVDVSTPEARSVLALSTLSYLVLLTMLMGGVYLAIDATAGERERGSLEPLLTVPVARESLMFGKILATCAYMFISLVLVVIAFGIVLRYAGLERHGMSVNFGAPVALGIIGSCLPLIPLGAAFMTLIAARTRTYREAQTWLGIVLLVPTLPLLAASTMGLKATLRLMAVPSLGQHFLIQALLRQEPLPRAFVWTSVGATLLLGAIVAAFAGQLYRRQGRLG
jgi:sodium transport system permease protein